MLNTVLTAIQVLHPGYAGPARLVIDYEAAAILAVRQVLPQTQLDGCTFHLGDSFARKVI